MFYIYGDSKLAIELNLFVNLLAIICFVWSFNGTHLLWICLVYITYRQTSNISSNLVCNKRANHSGVFGAAPAPTTYLHSRDNIWLQWNGQSQLQDCSMRMKSNFLCNSALWHKSRAHYALLQYTTVYSISSPIWIFISSGTITYQYTICLCTQHNPHNTAWRVRHDNACNMSF